MKLLFDHWPAKIVSLVLAVILWAVIKRSIATTGLPFKYQLHGQQQFQFRSSHREIVTENR